MEDREVTTKLGVFINQTKTKRLYAFKISLFNPIDHLLQDFSLLISHL